MKMFGQFLLCLILIYHVITYFWVPIFNKFFINHELTLEFTISTIFDLMLPGVLIVILGKSSLFLVRYLNFCFKAFYGFFHCWMNAFAELLRFADRMFYEVST